MIIHLLIFHLYVKSSEGDHLLHWNCIPKEAMSSTVLMPQMRKSVRDNVHEAKKDPTGTSVHPCRAKVQTRRVLKWIPQHHRFKSTSNAKLWSIFWDDLGVSPWLRKPPYPYIHRYQAKIEWGLLWENKWKPWRSWWLLVAIGLSKRGCSVCILLLPATAISS